MKKIYFLLILLVFSCFSYGQSVIVTVDRENIIGPTATGNATSISASGLVRGAGVNFREGNNFSTRNWTSTSQAEAATNDKYIEWSVIANPNYNVEITELDIKLRRDTNGPGNWQIFYSTDGFATAGTPLSGSQTLAANSDVSFNFSGLSINASSSTVTFRLYAWGAVTSYGWIQVRKEALWSDFGIDFPGIRMFGNIISTSPNSNESNIITAAYDPQENIDYTLYSATSGLTTVNSLKLAEFTIQDGGDDLTDADALGTILTDIGFDVNGYTNLAAMALFDGVTNIGEITVVDGNVMFTSINSGSGLTAPDGGTYNFDVYATFNSSVTDNEQIVVTVNEATADGTNGSTFEEFDAGGATSSSAGDDNRIEVVATTLAFDQNTTDVYQFEIMIPAPSVLAVDINDNLDLDFTDLVSLTTGASFDPAATTAVNAVSGIAIFNNLVFSAEATGALLTASAVGMVVDISDSFDVLAPRIIIAIQDFDNTGPEWTYSNDVPFFDNGFGIDGFYGIIDINLASPLDYPFFMNNILGENDLNDEGNGTNGFATITFDDVDLTCYEDVVLSFDWDIDGYDDNSDDALYEVFYDGVGQGQVFIFDGNGPEESDEGSVVLNIPNSVTMVSLQVSIRNNGNHGYSGFDNFMLTTAFDGLIYRNNVWTPSAPSDLTGTDDALILNGTYSVDSDVVLNNLFMANVAEVDIEPARSLTLNGKLVGNGNLTLQSTGVEYSSLINHDLVYGDVNYSRHVNNTAASGQNDLIAPPVSGQPFDVFRANNPNIHSNGANTLFLFGPFDKSTATYILYTDTETAPLDAGTGYRAASTDDGNFEFTGLVNTGNIDVPIVNSGPSHAQWNLIGNPYPTYLRLDDFLAANSSEFDPPTSGVYGYDGDILDGWVIWNQAYSDANPNAIIAPGQGFFVASVSGGGTISFTPSMRAIGSDDDFIPGFSQQNTSITHVKLNLSNSTQSYGTDFYFSDNASLGLDPGYDSASFGSSPDFAIYSHLVQENTGLDFAIQSVGNIDLENNVVIPLGINAPQGEQISFSISESTLSPDVEVYLEDTVANTTTLLNTSDYIITPTSDLSGTGRFNLRFENETLSDTESDYNKLHVFNKFDPNILFVNGNLNEDSLLRLYDIQGRMVKSVSLNMSNDSHQINLSDLSGGIYVVQITNTMLNQTQKIVVK